MRSIRVDIPGCSYQVLVGSGARKELNTAIATLSDVSRLAVVVDQNLAVLHLPALLEVLPLRPAVLTFQPGEPSKSFREAERLYDQLANARIGRRDLIITFGGGVAGDLGGFVAATWLRGVRYMQVPTSLEAAIDASIGGKTAVNHASGKNLIGAFHQPSAVVIDTDFLGTLSERDHVAALAESVKHALILDESFFAWHETHVDEIRRRDAESLEELIARNCEIKSAIVARDERESDLRMMLNFGHTIGHSLEHLLEYELRHGECVALGIVVANQIAVARGMLDAHVAERIEQLLVRLGLPIRLPRPLPADAVLATCQSDKKIRKGALQFILLSGIGTAVRVGDVSDDEIRAALRTIQPGR